MGAEEITAFLTHLAVKENVSASTQNQAFFALLYLYRDVLRIDLPNIEGVIRAKRPEHLLGGFYATRGKGNSGKSFWCSVFSGEFALRRRFASDRSLAFAGERC